MGAQNSQLATGRRQDVGKSHSRSITQTRNFFVTCHNCDYEIHQLKEVKFCYNCGAKQSRFSAYRDETNVKSQNQINKLLTNNKVKCNNRRSTSQVVEEDDIRENIEKKKPMVRQKRKPKKSNKRCKSVEYVPFSQSQMYSSFKCRTPTEKIDQEIKQKKTHRRFSSQISLNEHSFPESIMSKRPKGDPTMDLESKKVPRASQGKKERRLSRQLSDSSGQQLGFKKNSKKEHRRFNSVILSGLDIKSCTETPPRSSHKKKEKGGENKKNKKVNSVAHHKRRYSQPIISSQIAHLTKGKCVDEYLYYEIQKPQNKKEFEVLQKRDPLRNVKAKQRRLRRNGVLVYNDGVLYNNEKNMNNKYFPQENGIRQRESEVYSQRSSVCEPEDNNIYNDTCNDIKNVERLEPLNSGKFQCNSTGSDERYEKQNKEILISNKNSGSLEDSLSCSRTPDPNRASSLSMEKLCAQTPSGEDTFWSEKRRAELQGSANRKRKRNKFFLQKRIKKYNNSKNSNKSNFINDNDIYEKGYYTLPE